MKESEEVTEYTKHVLQLVLEKNDEISQLIWDIVDTQDTWDQAIESINQAILRKAIENGISLNGQSNYKFQTLNIHDMYVLQQGKLCTRCKVDKWCEKHQLKKQKEHFDEDDFDRIN